VGVLPDQETTELYQSIHDQASAGDGPAPPRSQTGSTSARLSAEAVEGLQAEALATHYRALAGRLGEAGRLEDALISLVRAARLESKRGAPLAARRILEQGQALLREAGGPGEDSSAALDLHLALAVLAEESDDLAGARAALEAAERLAEGLADSRRLAKTLIARSRVLQRGGEEGAAWDCARRGLALAARVGDEDAWLDGERFIARLHLVAGPGQRLAEHLAERAGRSGASGLPAEAAQAATLLGLARAAAGEFAEAQEDCARAVGLAGESRRPDDLAAALEAQGLVRLWCGQAGAALESFARAIEIAEARGDLLRRYVLGGFRGLALLAGGRRGAARRELIRAQTMAKRLGTRFLLAFFKAGLAESACQPGRERDVSGLSHEVLSLAARTNQPWAGSVAARALAVALARPKVRDLVGAERAIDRAVAAQRGLGLRFELARSLLVQARILEARGKSRQSGEAGTEAGELFRRMGLPAGAGVPELG
jgi:tetratricopeptide (TPR) repeat protein